MFEAAQVEHTHTAVSTAADKHVDAVRTEPNIVHLLVVSNQLRLGSQRRDVPDSARCINAGGDDQAWGNGVPVERSDGSGVLRGLGVGQQC